MLHSVKYLSAKSLHVDQLIPSCLNIPQETQAIYDVALLSKAPYWSSEAEIRFVSQKQNVMVRIKDSQISAIILGALLDSAVRRRIEEIVKSLKRLIPLLQYPE